MEPAVSSEGTEVPEGEVYSNVGFGREWFFKDEFQTPKVGGLRTPRFCSTRVPSCELQPSQTASNVELSTLISELANQIGQSIAAQVQGDKRDSESVSTEVHKSEQRPSELNLSGVKLVMQSDVKEPQIFRGDNSDKCSVHEWVEMMELYLLKRDTPTHNQSQEILARLMGKAKDVVKVTLRNSSSLDHIQTPELIFDILKQNFSELSYSSMAMADFYNTKPLPREGVMEYWIRLNKAVDIAGECLWRQGRSVEDPGHEVSMMFIKYCPDPILSNRFSFKSSEEWTTSEVQERIDTFQREYRARSQASCNVPERYAVSHVQAAIPQEPLTSQPAQPSQVPIHTLSVPASTTQLTQCTSPIYHAPATVSQPELESVPCHSAPAPTPVINVNGMRTLINLLDRMITHQNEQGAAHAPALP